MLTTPYYFPAGQTELTAYIKNIAPRIALPLVLYNMPGLTKVWFEMETLRRLSQIATIVGVKDSSGDLQYFSELCRLKKLRPDWRIYIGPEAMLQQAHARGGDGGVCGGANVAPDLFVKCYQSLVEKDEVEYGQIQQQIERFQEIYDIGKYASRYIKATKSALSLMNICSDLPADPFNRFLPPQREQVAEILKELDLL